MAEELDFGPWTPKDVELLSGAASLCLDQIEAGHKANPNSQRLASRSFLESYLAHLADPDYAMPFDEDKRFVDYLYDNDPAALERLMAPARRTFTNLSPYR